MTLRKRMIINKHTHIDHSYNFPEDLEHEEPIENLEAIQTKAKKKYDKNQHDKKTDKKPKSELFDKTVSITSLMESILAVNR